MEGYCLFLVWKMKQVHFSYTPHWKLGLWLIVKRCSVNYLLINPVSSVFLSSERKIFMSRIFCKYNQWLAIAF